MNPPSSEMERNDKVANGFIKAAGFGLGLRFLQLIGNLWITGFAIAQMGPQSWGMISVALSVSSLSGLLQLGAATGLAKRLASSVGVVELDRIKQIYADGRVISSLGFFAILFIGVAASSLISGELFFAKGNVLGALIAISTLQAAIIVLSIPNVAALQSQHQLQRVTYCEGIALVARLIGLPTAFALIEPSPIVFVYVSVVGAILQCALIGLIARRRIEFTGRPIARSSARGVLDLVRFNGVLAIDSVNYLVSLQAPTLFFGGDFTSAGKYGVCLQINNLLRGFVQPIQAALLPPMSVYTRRSPSELMALYLLAHRGFVAAGSAIAIGIALLGADLIEIWLSGKISAASMRAGLVLMGCATGLGIASIPSALLLIVRERVLRIGLIGLICSLFIVLFTSTQIPDSSSERFSEATKFVLGFYGLHQVLRIMTAFRASGVKLSYGIGTTFRAIVSTTVPFLMVSITIGAHGPLSASRVVAQAASATIIALIGFYFACLNSTERASINSVIGRTFARKRVRND